MSGAFTSTHDGTTAMVIRRGDGRFWCGFNKRGGAKTAWCLAGAKLLQLHEVKDVLRRLMRSRTASRHPWFVLVITMANAEPVQ